MLGEGKWRLLCPSGLSLTPKDTMNKHCFTTDDGMVINSHNKNDEKFASGKTYFLYDHTQPAFICSKLAIETSKQGVK